MELRKFNDEIEICFNYETNPMIKVTDENITFYQTRIDKINALENRKKSDKFLIAWQGKWRTDVFAISEYDIKSILPKVETQRLYSEEEVRIMISQTFKASDEGYDITADEIIDLIKNR